MPAEETAFDLVDQPWLPVLTTDGKPDVLSLRQVLHRAHRVRDLVVDVPTQFPPLLRLLLAVLHRALAGPRSFEDWDQLWRDGEFTTGLIDAHLNKHRHRFDLFHPTAPFMQVASLQAGSGDTKTVAILIPHAAAGNNVPLFSGTLDGQPPVLSLAEAARWLVHAHAWDTAAIKTGAVGDPQAKNGKTTGNPPGYLGELGMLMPIGRTLFETLVLNLHLPEDPEAIPEDLPCWEREADTAEWKETDPTGPVQLYTWQSRRVRLFPEPGAGGYVVRHCLVAAGDRPRPWNLRRVEPHSGFRHSPNLEKRLSRSEVFRPVLHNPNRQLWRGLGSMLALGETPSGWLPAMILVQLGKPGWLRLLERFPLRVRAAGVSYGNQRAIIDDVYDDEIPMPVALLAEEENDWQHAALWAVEAADAAAGALAGLARDLAKAAGARDQQDGYVARVQGRLWSTLDIPFRQWLASLNDEDAEPPERVRTWAGFVRGRSLSIAEEVLAQASPVTVTGRPKDPRKPELGRYTAAGAELIFHGRLRRALAIAEEAYA